MIERQYVKGECGDVSTHHRATPCTTIDLLRRPNRESNTAVPEQRRCGTTVAAQIEVDVGPVLVGVRGGLLAAQRIALARTQVVDHHNDRSASVGKSIAAAVC